MVNPKPSGDEDQLLARIAAVLGRVTPPEGEVWIGDDAAVVVPPPGSLVIATDAVVGGVHADLSLTGLDDLGWKALAVTLSDVGAMGARPLHAVVTLCLPPGTDTDRLVEGVAEAASAFACPVVGGDLTSSAQVMVSVAATGVLEGPAPPVLRSGASGGDTLLITGPLGSSAAGLRLLRQGGGDGAAPGAGGGRRELLVAAHRRPVPRLAEGVAARQAGATAMMDVSDGLALDLHRLADASGIGFALVDLPVAEGATLEEALAGGEDYELVIATPDPDGLAAAFLLAGLRAPVVIGVCTADPFQRLFRGERLERRGWQHRLRES